MPLDQVYLCRLSIGLPYIAASDLAGKLDDLALLFGLFTLRRHFNFIGVHPGLAIVLRSCLPGDGSHPGLCRVFDDWNLLYCPWRLHKTILQIRFSVIVRSIGGAEKYATRAASTLATLLALRCCRRALLLPVLAFGELLNHLSIECRDIIGLTARDQSVIGDHLLIDPLGAGIDQIRFQ